MSVAAEVRTATWPGELIDRLWRVRPARGAPVTHHMVWHQEMAPLWDEIAAMDAVLADNARRMADFHRNESARLAEVDPDRPDDSEW